MSSFRDEPRFSRHVMAWHTIPAVPAQYGAFPDGLDDRVLQALEVEGVHRLYSHQSSAADAALRGDHVAVATSSASGKSLCYNLPVLQCVLLQPDATALYLFPTKALAQDQLAAWQRLTSKIVPGVAACYDGDTPSSSRVRIRDAARVIITNPDMLHAGILPYHPKWRRFLSQLRFVVLDEMHTYRGVFGSHTANVLRRLRRVCRFHGSRPTFVCASATVSNPRELAEAMIEEPVVLINKDGSPRGQRELVFYNPPVVDRFRYLRRNVVLEAATVADTLLEHHLSTIVFARSRLATELLLTYLRQAQEGRGSPSNTVRGYRGGYLPRERRSIEQGLRSGSIQGVVSTNALELGVDIGTLQACVLCGYPGTIASTWQQIGRAGRRCDGSLAVVVGGPGPLDQYLLAHPEFLLARSPEKAVVYPDNPYLLRSHLQCAAFEIPIADSEPLATTGRSPDLLQDLAKADGVLRHSHDRWYWSSATYPATQTSLRAAGSETFAVVTESGRAPIATIDGPSAPRLVHPGAVYLHEGEPYSVRQLDWRRREALVEPASGHYFTEARSVAKLASVREADRISGDNARRAQGEVSIQVRVTSFRQLAWYTHEELLLMPLELPEQLLQTAAYWICLGESTVNFLRDQGDWTIAPILSYGPNWAEQRDRARERDHYRCTRCGAAESTSRQHDVHHIAPFRTFDYRPGMNTTHLAANDLNNLVTLCPLCHHSAEAAVALQGTLDGFAHLLRSLAPLHVMCDARDLGTLVDLEPPIFRAPTVMLYDTAPGGLGFSSHLYTLHTQLIAACRDWIARCHCREGCPACTGPPGLHGGAKQRVGRLLRVLASDT